MKGKYRSAPDEHYSSSESNRYYDSPSPHQPVKSPSPDKRAASIIVCTKSPELTEYRHMDNRDQPNCHCHYHHSQQHSRQKPFPVRTPSKHQNTSAHKAQDTQPDTHQGKNYISESRMRNPKISIQVESLGDGFEGVSRIRELGRSESSQLDYIKLLRSKEETIKELKEIIEMIKRNGTSYEEVDQSQKMREIKQKAHDLSLEVKQLKIQNQHLLNAIERNKKGNLSNTSNSPQMKDQILQRQIRQLKETLRVKEVELADLGAAYERKFYNQQQYIGRIEGQNQSLLRLLKEKEESLGNSSLSAKSTDKQKLTLIKIREQYNENLKLMKDNFYGQLQEMENGYANQVDELHRRIDSYSARMSTLQSLKPKQEKRQVREEYHREKIRQQEIQNLMLEKYSKYEKEIQQHRKNNDRLIQELLNANKKADDLNRLVAELQRDIAKIKQTGQGDVSQLLEERKVLFEKSNQLEVENLALRRQYEDLGNKKAKEIDELEKKIEVLLMDYEHHSKEDKNSYEATVSKLKQQLEEAEDKRKEIIDYYEKDKIDTEQKVKMAIDIYNRQNEQLQATIGQKSHELQQRNHELEMLRDELQRYTQRSVDSSELQKVARQCEQSRKRCQRLQTQIGQLNHELVKMSQLLKEREEHAVRVQNTLNASQQEKDNLLRKLNESQLHNNDLTVRSSRREMEAVQLSKRVQVLERDISNSGHNHNQVVNSLRQQIAALQHKNSQLGGQLFQKNQELQNQLGLISKLQRELKQQLARKGWQGEPIEDELKELRKVVCECFLKLSGSSEKQIVEEYYRLNYNYELKLEENLKLMKEADDWKNERAEQQRQKEILNEKIALLEQNNAIYERELKERRNLYEQLIQEKSRIQRQILMAKKIKVEQSQIDQNNQNTVAEITARIDRLLDLERQRNQQSRIQLRSSPSHHAR